jgi:NDP-sugar pyrophosphorylase family protein
MAGLKAMVLAAGVGERMRPLTDHHPKPLLPVANRPVMGWVLTHLARHGFKEVIANLHYRAEDIVERMGPGSEYGVELTFSYEEELLGSAGGVRRCREFFGDETFLVTGADDLTTMDLTSLLAAHREVGAMASIALVEVEETSQYGIVVTDEEGRIQRFVEKPRGRAPSRTANTQIYLFEAEVLDLIPPDQVYDFGFQVFPAMVEAGVPFYGFRLDGYWRDIGSIRDYLEAQTDALEGRLDGAIEGNEVSPGVWMGKGCLVERGAKLVPPVLLGGNCRVGAKARVGEGTVLGAGAEVGAGAGVWKSVVWDGARVPASSKLRETVVTAEGVFRG